MLDLLEKYYESGLVHKQNHPTLDLTIWNYSPKVQYERLWDDITLQCRGLVTNSKGDVIARPFKKFFNYDEHKPEDIPHEHYEVFEKMDGSLGILFNYENEWIMATRGSFTSPQAIKGKEILDKKYDISALRKDNTLLFEIIYPENRIVVDYGKEEKLVVLGGFHTKTGDEIPYSSLFYMTECGFELVRIWKTWNEDWKTLQKEISKENEGYVIRFKSGFRMKIKGDEYVRLHKILTNISNRDIFEYVKEGKSLDEILDKVPDEFYNWVKETKEQFEQQFKTIDLEYRLIFKNITERNNITDKKMFAHYALSYTNSSILFAMFDNKEYKHIIWKIIYPNYSKPFKNDKEN